MQGGAFLKNKVEQLRKERGLNQDDFAKMLRVSRQTISSIETGKYNPSLELAFSGQGRHPISVCCEPVHGH
jgi:putative transcriptional regulator